MTTPEKPIVLTIEITPEEGIEFPLSLDGWCRVLSLAVWILTWEDYRARGYEQGVPSAPPAAYHLQIEPGKPGDV